MLKVRLVLTKEVLFMIKNLFWSNMLKKLFTHMLNHEDIKTNVDFFHSHFSIGKPLHLDF